MSVNIYQPNAQDSLSLAELDLYHQIMDYRAEEGLGAIPLSKSLTTTAGRHVVDTRENIWGEDLRLPSGANLHSWSDAPYYADGRDPRVMWDAPERLNTGYTSSGYEISAAGQPTAAAALAGWKASPGHNDILTNQNAWANIDFNAIGIGLDTSAGPGPYGGRVYHVWFGAAADRSGPPNIMGSDRSDVMTGTSFRDLLFGGNGNDRMIGGDGNDYLNGGSGNDSLSGSDGNDQLYGRAGNDVINGGIGNDYISGYSGNDSLAGFYGDDTLHGSSGIDRLSGGGGRDVFLFSLTSNAPRGAVREAIVDFTHGYDRIDLSEIDADLGRAGNQAFEFIGREGFGGNAGELRYVGGILSGDVNGDGVADLQIEITNLSALTSTDFIL